MPIMMGPFASLKFLALIYAISAIAVLPIRDVAPGSLTPDRRAAKSGIVVVQCSRATGRVAPRRRLRESGIVAGEDLSPQKARALLMLLTATDIATIQGAYQTY
jgi:L-asparaginase